MKIRQHASFSLMSDVMSAAAITAELGIEPDEIVVQGSRSREPLRPRHHAWTIVSDAPGLRVDQLVGELVARLQSQATAIGALALKLEEIASAPSRGGSVLRVVRHLGDEEDGEEEDEGLVELPNGVQLERLAGQHQLLGWALERSVIDFLVRTRAYLDVDEYG